MSINSVKLALRTLPYTEMKALGDQVVLALRGAPASDGWMLLEPAVLCDVLAALPIREEQQLETEEVFLSRAFTKKRGGKCTIELKRVGSGWEARTGDFTHTGPSVRSTVSELLDQIAGYEALMGGEGRAL